jgi:hypothetical protein
MYSVGQSAIVEHGQDGNVSCVRQCYICLGYSRVWLACVVKVNRTYICPEVRILPHLKANVKDLVE